MYGVNILQRFVIYRSPNGFFHEHKILLPPLSEYLFTSKIPVFRKDMILID